jgi:CelD/BcsL family acetyltransferase involved in cellulose biosynthesis
MNAPLTSRETSLKSAVKTVDGMRIRVFDDLEAVKPIWASLEATGISSVYQSFVWCRTWQQRVGRQRQIVPCVVVGENAMGTTEFILPLQIRHRLGVTIIEALTAPQSSYGFGLFSRGFLQSQAEGWFSTFFADVVAVLPKHDILHLADLPEAIANSHNPLLSVRHFSAANLSYIMRLDSDFQALLEAKRSPESRRSMRKRDVKLEAMGNLIFDLPLNLADRKSTVETMLVQQRQRLAEMGVHNVFDELEQRFIADLVHVQTAEGPLLRPYRLVLDGNILAVPTGP